MSEWSERFKLALHNRIKKGTVEIKDLPDGGMILIKGRKFVKEKTTRKGRLIPAHWRGRYRIINPPVVEQEDGSLKFIPVNFLFNGWGNLWKLIGIVAIAAIVFSSVHGLFVQYAKLTTNICYTSCFSHLGTALVNNGSVLH
jgi:hypothetical protein